jgi:arginine exporter protein ArgO
MEKGNSLYNKISCIYCIQFLGYLFQFMYKLVLFKQDLAQVTRNEIKTKRRKLIFCISFVCVTLLINKVYCHLILLIYALENQMFVLVQLYKKTAKKFGAISILLLFFFHLFSLEKKQ